jgi:hypothetical protein
MRSIGLLAATLVLAGAAFAQNGRGITGTGGGGGAGLPYRTFGSPSGFGNILAPGVGTLPPLTNGATFPQRLGNTISGFPPYTGTAGRSGVRGRGAVAIPYAVPVWVGGYGSGYGYDAPYPYQQQPQVTVIAPPPQPPVIINQYFTSDTARPVMHEYAPGSLPDPNSGGTRTYTAPSGPVFAEPNDQKATIWLIAFKDGSIYPAIGFWMEGDTVHYITKDGSHNRASLDRIDRDFSEQLNRERGLEFKLGK